MEEGPWRAKGEWAVLHRIDIYHHFLPTCCFYFGKEDDDHPPDWCFTWSYRCGKHVRRTRSPAPLCPACSSKVTLLGRLGIFISLLAMDLEKPYVLRQLNSTPCKQTHDFFCLAFFIFSIFSNFCLQTSLYIFFILNTDSTKYIQSSL